MHQIRKMEDDLFRRWKAHINADDQTFFVQDGALDPEAYQNSSLKICSVLKETPIDNTADPKGYHFGEGVERKIIAKGTNYYLTDSKTALNVLAKRILIIRKITNVSNEINLLTSLLESAYVNIKKHNGAKKSKESDLKRVAKSGKDFLVEHFDSILKPDILLCGKTFHYIRQIYGGENFIFLMQDEQNKVKLFHQIENGIPKRLVIEMYHPMHQSSEKELLRKLESLIQLYMSSDNCIFK